MAKRTPPFSEYPEWTSARFWSFVRSALRQAFTRWPPKYKALNNAKRAYKGGGRQKWEYQCAICSDWFMQKQVEVDHVEPTGSLKDYKDLPGFVQRMFVHEDKMQVACKECHKAKTKRERNNV